jgi:hypothetical protein
VARSRCGDAAREIGDIRSKAGLALFDHHEILHASPALFSFPFETAPASTEQCVVVGVGADPTPHEPVSVKGADSAIMDTDADRPEISPHFLEVQ